MRERGRRRASATGSGYVRIPRGDTNMTKTVRAARRSPRKTAGMVVIAAMALLAAAAVAGYVPSSVTAAASQYGPTNTAKPTISDTTPQSGQTLTASPGTWTGDQPI